MNNNVIKALITKDIRTIIRSKSLLMVLIIIPIVLGFVIPTAIIASIRFFAVESTLGPDVKKLLTKFLAEVPNVSLALDTFKQQMIYIFVNYLFASFFLLVPIVTASVTAANSFVGEKERRTLESLLFAPITIKELFVAKILASFLPSYFISIVSFIMTGISINILSYPLFHQIIFPTGNWVILITCLSPMILLLTILLNILISARVQTYQEAQNIGGIIVLPVIAMVIGQVSGLFLIGTKMMLLLSIALLIINLLLIKKIAKNNDRHVLFEKQIH
ncbi:ABC transporter permease subunit [Niallia sp. 01092]|uniref:ABC transporter permease subunit n=1 Tax=unclassified Niallia TaxID=2837522 RepID=UPI003FD3714E